MKYSNLSTLNHAVTVINRHPTSQLLSDPAHEFAFVAVMTPGNGVVAPSD